MSGNKIRINNRRYENDVKRIKSGAEELTSLEAEKEAPGDVTKNKTVPLYEEADKYTRQCIKELHCEVNKITTTMTTIKKRMVIVDQQGAAEMRSYRGSMVQ